MTAGIARSVAAAAGFAVLAVAAGCSSKANVSGKVSYHGKALTSGSVSLIARDNIQYSGPISADGTYSIPSVPGGAVKILVTSPNPDSGGRKASGGNGDVEGVAAPGVGGWFPIPERYGSPTTSDLTGEVKGSTAELNVDLK